MRSSHVGVRVSTHANNRNVLCVLLWKETCFCRRVLPSFFFPHAESYLQIKIFVKKVPEWSENEKTKKNKRKKTEKRKNEKTEQLKNEKNWKTKNQKKNQKNEMKKLENEKRKKKRKKKKRKGTPHSHPQLRGSRYSRVRTKEWRQSQQLNVIICAECWNPRGLTWVSLDN